MTGEVTRYDGENTSCEPNILLTGVPCEVCEHCDASALKAGKIKKGK
jgi:hypothetical protein